MRMLRLNMWYRRCIRIKNVKFLLIFLTMTYVSYCYFKVGSVSVDDSKVRMSYVMVHLDLKGAPPKLSYLMEVFPVWKQLGVNGLLIEYEDMFPYEGALLPIRSNNSYNKHELTNFLLDAAKHEFEVIPLIQTFGHMEFVLKQQRYMSLREDPAYNDVICPSQDESFMLIKQMLTQILLFHHAIQPLNYVHIGCDEVYHIKKCSYCRARKITKNQIFQEAVNKTQKFINYLLPEVTVLIWDDMLRKRNKHIIDLQIEPVVWHYHPDTPLSHVDLYRYHKKFKDMWLATAFKGAETPTSLLPDLHNRYSNHFNVLKFIKGYRFGGARKIFNFKGIILTGWSRFTHMTPIVELLPAAYPSLVVNLVLIQKILNNIVNDLSGIEPLKFFNQYLAKDVAKYLNCHKVVQISDLTTKNCKYSGSHLHENLASVLKMKHDLIHSHEYDIFLEMEYYNKTGYMNSNWIDLIYSSQQQILNKVNLLEEAIRTDMKRYYDDFVIEEYVNYVTFSVKNMVIRNLNIMNGYKGIKTWQDRREVKLLRPNDKKISVKESQSKQSKD